MAAYLNATLSRRGRTMALMLETPTLLFFAFLLSHFANSSSPPFPSLLMMQHLDASIQWRWCEGIGMGREWGI